MVEMTEPQKVKLDELIAKLEVYEGRKKTATEEMEGKKGGVDLTESGDDDTFTAAEEREIM